MIPYNLSQLQLTKGYRELLSTIKQARLMALNLDKSDNDVSIRYKYASFVCYPISIMVFGRFWRDKKFKQSFDIRLIIFSTGALMI